MISIDNLRVDFGGFTLFDDISFVINKKDRIALTGRNGAGKTTLLRIIAGLQSPTSGTVSIPHEMTIGYLPQVMKLTNTLTVRQEVEKAFSHLQDMEDEIATLNNQLSERTDYESESYHHLIDRMTHLTDQFHIAGGGNIAAELEKTLIGLGFRREDFDRPTAEFSGGWRMRIELARLLLQHPDVLLLDEPTNHLDIESIQWLETFIATQADAVVLVSHDRAFVNNTTTRTLEIELGKIYDYKVKYDQYEELRKERREQQLRSFKNQQKMLADTESFIERFRYKPTKSTQVQSRIKQLEKIERIEVDEVDNSILNLKFPPAPHCGSYPVIMENVSKSFGDNNIFRNVTITIERGEKVAFVGRNGEGKTTLVRCIMGELNDFGGTLKLGQGVKIGYFAQNQAQLLDGNLTVFETIDNVAVGDIRTKIRDILGAFMFGGEASDKKVSVLSGGERSRLAMIRLLLEPVNLLILDEPTNHLDIPSKDVLKNALNDFDGTVILVSHDRDFLNGLVSKVYEFGNQQVVCHIGGIYDFLEHKKIDSLHELERRKELNRTSDIESAAATENRQSYEAMKERSRILKKAEKNVATLEESISSLESSLEEVNKKLATPEGMADISLCTEYASLKDKLDKAMEDWTKETETLENLKKQYSE